MWALPGFMGLPSDWERVPFKNVPQSIRLEYFLVLNMEEWIQKFHHHVRRADKEAHILIGYSMGGRFALQACLHETSFWSSAIIISAHPGLISEAEKQSRLTQDEGWAKKFEGQLPWDLMMEDWNKQAVFRGEEFTFKREEKNYDRRRLADLLRLGSLGRQAYLVPALAKLTIPILWIVGERDTKYRNIIEHLAFKHPLSRTVVINKGGHRVAWEQPNACVHLIEEFLEEINRN